MISARIIICTSFLHIRILDHVTWGQFDTCALVCSLFHTDFQMLKSYHPQFYNFQRYITLDNCQSDGTRQAPRLLPVTGHRSLIQTSSLHTDTIIHAYYSQCILYSHGKLSPKLVNQLLCLVNVWHGWKRSSKADGKIYKFKLSCPGLICIHTGEEGVSEDEHLGWSWIKDCPGIYLSSWACGDV